MLKNKLSTNIAALFLFCAINTILISLLFLFSGNIFLEIYKFLQILAIFVLCLSLIKNKTISFFTITLIYCLYLILASYFISTNSRLDFSFLARNIKDISAIVPQFLLPAILILITGLLGSFSIYQFKNIFKKNWLCILPAILIAGAPFFTKAAKENNEFIYFLKSAYQKDKIIDYYQNNVYSSLLEQSANDKKNLPELIKTEEKNRPDYLDNIVIIQLESLNGFLVNENNAPNFLKIAKEGIFFPQFYGNSVQTILAQENILCSLPSSFDINLVQGGADKKILCLPEILKSLGYKNIFAKSYNLNFSRTGLFMKNIGFDEVHADDLMDKNDPKYLWGYREDIFYKKTFNYLEKNKQDKYNFFYVEIGPTNHWPFKTPIDLKNSVPFKNAANHQERLINTTWLQDQYLKIAWGELNRIFPKKNYTAIILGDHSWPAEIHKDNTFNEKNSFEENFLTSMIMVIGDEEKYKGKIINSKRSEMDILPSLMDLFGVKTEKNKFRSSFINEINNKDEEKNNIILIQPYSEKYLNIIDYPLKYQYNSEKETLYIYDLSNDPKERNGRIIKDKNTIMKIIKNMTLN